MKKMSNRVPISELIELIENSQNIVSFSEGTSVTDVNYTLLELAKNNYKFASKHFQFNKSKLSAAQIEMISNWANIYGVNEITFIDCVVESDDKSRPLSKIIYFFDNVVGEIEKSSTKFDKNLKIIFKGDQPYPELLHDNTTNDIVVINRTKPVDKKDLKNIKSLIKKNLVIKICFNNSNISKDSSTNVYLDKITSFENHELEELIFNNIKLSKDTVPPYVMSSMFAKPNFLEPVRFVNLTSLEIKNSEIPTITYYNFIKMIGFDSLKKFISINVSIINVEGYLAEIIGLLKECLDSRSTKITFISDLIEQSNTTSCDSIKNHNNIDYHSVKTIDNVEVPLFGESHNNL